MRIKPREWLSLPWINRVQELMKANQRTCVKWVLWITKQKNAR